jgi:hypothetical protein
MCAPRFGGVLHFVQDVIMTLVLAVALIAAAQPAQAPPPTEAHPPASVSSVAASANPELVGQLVDQLKITPAQAQGMAGALFGLAKTRLKPEEFAQVAAAVPGMDGLLKAAPVVDSKVPAAVAGAAGSMGGLSSLAGSFSKLGVSPEMATKAVPILTDFAGKKGGADVGKLLAGALK